jgi:hypothetical protein
MWKRARVCARVGMCARVQVGLSVCLWIYLCICTGSVHVSFVNSHSKHHRLVCIHDCSDTCNLFLYLPSDTLSTFLTQKLQRFDQWRDTRYTRHISPHYVYIHMYAHVYVYMYVCMCTNMCMCMRMCMCTCMCMCIPDTNCPMWLAFSCPIPLKGE